MRKDRGRVRLQRTLVFAEARVAIDAIERGLRRRDQIRRERLEVFGEPFDDRDHRLADLTFVGLAPGLEPFAIVVAFDGPEEGYRAGRETSSHQPIVPRP